MRAFEETSNILSREAILSNLVFGDKNLTHGKNKNLESGHEVSKSTPKQLHRLRYRDILSIMLYLNCPFFS